VRRRAFAVCPGLGENLWRILIVVFVCFSFEERLMRQPTSRFFLWSDHGGASEVSLHGTACIATDTPWWCHCAARRALVTGQVPVWAASSVVEASQPP